MDKPQALQHEPQPCVDLVPVRYCLFWTAFRLVNRCLLAPPVAINDQHLVVVVLDLVAAIGFYLNTTV